MRFLAISTPVSFVLQPVEAKHVDRQRNHWRQVSGVSALTQSLGIEPRMFPNSPYIALSDDGEHHFSELDFRWINANAGHPSQSLQWQLGFRGHLDVDVGDLLAIVFRHEPMTLAGFVAPARSTRETQLTTLIGTPSPTQRVFRGNRLPEVAYLPIQELYDLAGWLIPLRLRRQPLP